MKSAKTIFIAALGVAVASAVAYLVILQSRPSSGEQEVALTQPANKTSPVVTQAPAPTPVPPPEQPITATSEVESVQAPVQTRPMPQNTAAQNTRPDERRQDPLARAALSLVGADPDAEQYWMEAIFDPSLSDHEREDLMEDLNEEGLSDPRRPGPEDMQLIANRIATIERVAPHADKFMLVHLAEAYKDLWNLLYGLEPQ